jgi:hypothetical protein
VHRHHAHRRRATASIAPVARKPFTSFTTAQPASIAARITSGFMVSTETATPPAPAPRHRHHAPQFLSTAPAAPGRVDSPPTSTRSAPSSRSAGPARSPRRVEEAPAVGERIGRDVHDAHHDERARKGKRGGPWPPLLMLQLRLRAQGFSAGVVVGAGSAPRLPPPLSLGGATGFGTGFGGPAACRT